MKASSFAYHRPADRAAAIEMLASLSAARLIAGGQSLVAMLNMRYAFVENLIDINRVAGLAGIDVRGGTARIGAMTRQRTMLEDVELAARAPIIGEALRFVGHLHTRNRGTIGGSLAHMDPAAELMNVATLLDATVHVESARGVRDVSIADYPVSFMTPQLEPDEMIAAVTLRLPTPGHGWSFYEFAQRHGDFAIVAVGVTVSLTAGRVAEARAVLSGINFAPRRLGEVERMLNGETPSVALIADAAELAGKEEAISDAMASGEYRQHLAKVLTRRALTQALARAKEGAM
jgi:carbon-monoxide dehydrogenase medium subunit